MDKKAFLAVGLSLLIWVGWQKFYLEPIQLRAAAENQQRQELADKRANEAKAEIDAKGIFPEGQRNAGMQAKGAAQVVAPIKTVTLSNAHSLVTLSNESWTVKGWSLSNFSRTLEKLDEKVTVGDTTGFSTQLKVRFSDPNLSRSVERVWADIEKEGDRRATATVDRDGVQATRAFTLDENGYGARLDYSFKFSGEAPNFIYIDLYGSPKRATDKEGSIFGQAPDKVMVVYRDLLGRNSQIGAKLKEKESGVGVKWLGLETRYFALAMVPVANATTDIGAQVANDNLGEPAVRGSLVYPTGGKHEVAISAKVYFGPKDMERLTSVDPVLSDAIDFGWTSFIAIPLLQALKWLYSYVKNYGVAIIALTFLIKMLLFPLTYKSMKSMSKMTKLQPQLNALREKYKDNKEKLNVEMMNFMKANGYNPIGGCLPILLQMPIFFALYRVLFNSMELYQAPFAGWIHDLSSPDPFFVTPVLLCGLMYLQQKLSPNTAADPAQQKMLQIMPLMFGAFMLMLPSGLTIYMVVNSATSIGQQYFLNRKLGIRPGASQVIAKA